MKRHQAMILGLLAGGGCYLMLGWSPLSWGPLVLSATCGAGVFALLVRSNTSLPGRAFGSASVAMATALFVTLLAWTTLGGNSKGGGTDTILHSLGKVALTVTAPFGLVLASAAALDRAEHKRHNRTNHHPDST